MIEARLLQFAGEADMENAGALDDLSCHMKRMPEDLRAIRKKRIGRHRVYYTGTHHACKYEVVFVKFFKTTGEDDDDNRTFQLYLAKILGTETTKVIEPSRP